ncbi:ATP-dependent DNA helicase [Clostridium ljungdahlii]|uniref:ATP-dependent RecD-like DNA helicase n=1 Tax=Clostridium ljungdahlii TaxID=1538 RepID=A0A168PIP1_9CLOT|nr:AAA family ATPase [Clostridium ljungdahlii]OAA87791.1 ATP-dependent RecD-like DNA helicase [Clostridium ljungdahlii]
MKKDNVNRNLTIKEKLIYEFGDIGEQVVDELIVDYGMDITNMVNDRAYILSHYAISFKVIKEIIEKCSVNKDEDYKSRNIVAAAIIYINECMAKEGHVFTYKSELEDRLKELGVLNDEKLLDKILDFLSAENEIVLYRDLNENTCIYLSRLYNSEVKLAELITNFVEENKKINYDLDKVEKFIKSYISKNIRLNNLQQKAVKMSLSNKITCIAGVAGSGKTTVIKAIVEGFKYLKCNNIQLTSFTGKAVERMSCITGVQGSTIHRLLGIEREDNNNFRSIKADVLIVDEIGMIGLQLFTDLMISVKDNKNIRIVIVGDKFQLQSIDPGSVLKDLIKSGVIPVVYLQDVVRQQKNSLIISNANKIIKGIGINGEKSGIWLKKNEFEFINADGENIKEKVIGAVEKLLNKGTSIYDIQVMSPVKKGNNGVEQLNREIANEFNPIQERDIYKLGILDPVIVVRNNYRKNIFNGQKGIVKKVLRNMTEIESVTIDFSGKEITFKKNEVEDIEVAYVSTVHKMQGSESKVIIMIVDKEHKRMLSRELLYVAVTRCIERIIIIGNKDTFNEAVKRVIKERNSLLSDRIEENICILKK